MPDFIETLHRRLLELGCTPGRARRMVRELSDHREDLVQASVAEGATETTAQSRANLELGDPLLLADKLMIAARQSSWWGRHAFTSFCLLPLLAFPFIWGTLFLAGLWLGFALGYHLNSAAMHKAADDPVAFHRGMLLFYSLDLASLALVTALFCWLGRRSLVPLKWILLACLICGLYASFTLVQIRPHFIWAGFSKIPVWRRTLVPLLIASVTYLLHWRTTHSFRRQSEA